MSEGKQTCGPWNSSGSSREVGDHKVWGAARWGEKPADTAAQAWEKHVWPPSSKHHLHPTVTQAERSRGHVWVGSCDKNHPSSSDPLWGSKQNSIKTFIGCMIGLVSGPQTLPALSVCMFGNPQQGKKQKHQNETYNQLDYLVCVFACAKGAAAFFIIPDGANLAFFACPRWILFAQFCRSDEKKEQQEAWRLHTRFGPITPLLPHRRCDQRSEFPASVKRRT